MKFKILPSIFAIAFLGLISIKSIEFFFYLLIMSCLIQVMRDGLLSIFVFPVINSMPLFLIYILHKIFIKPTRIATK